MRSWNIEKIKRQWHFSAYREKSIAFIKIKEFQFKDHSTEKKLSNKTLMEEVESIVKEK